MIRLNMLPDIKREYIRARLLEKRVIGVAVLVSAIAVGLVVVLALWVYGAQTLQSKALSSTINKNMDKLKSVKDVDKYVSIQNQLANISSLHAKKSIYSRLFDVLPSINPKAPNSVKISNLTVDSTTSTMALQGETSSFTALETFRDTLKNASLAYKVGDSKDEIKEPLFSTVTIDSQGISKGTSGNDVVSFKVTTVYSSHLFARDTKSYAVNIPNKETTQSKEDAPSLFGQSTVTNNKDTQ